MSDQLGVFEAIYSCRAMRRLKPDPVPEDLLLRLIDAAHQAPEGTIADTICCALRRTASILPVAATVTYTDSGFTSLRAARERPAVPILGMTPNLATARRLTLVWGVHPVPIGGVADVAGMEAMACEVALREQLARPGDIVAIAAGLPFGTPGTTNLLRIAQLPGGGERHA